jgi:hypothetical protein
MINSEDLTVNYITNEAGEKTGVILSITQFEELLEDLADLAIIAERTNESAKSHEDLVAELKRDDLI